jgi:hypothetical protein
MPHVQPQQVRECISGFSGIDDARTLYCTLLNYDYKDLPIPIEDWNRSTKEIIVEGNIIAMKSDLYVYFYYLALGLLKPGGVFCFISSNSWLDVGFGAKLQEFLLKNIETKAIYDNLPFNLL